MNVACMFSLRKCKILKNQVFYLKMLFVQDQILKIQNVVCQVDRPGVVQGHWQNFLEQNTNNLMRLIAIFMFLRSVRQYTFLITFADVIKNMIGQPFLCYMNGLRLSNHHANFQVEWILHDKQVTCLIGPGLCTIWTNIPSIQETVN